MKRSNTFKRVAMVALVATVLMMTGCSSTGSSTQATTAPTATVAAQTSSLPSFVAADKTNWDKEITIGENTYTLALTLNEDGTLALNGTCAADSTKNFVKSGSWTYDKGYGYTLTIDGYTTKTDFDKASSRQSFHAEVVVDGASSGLIEFQGKDSAFRKEIAADYQDFEIRDAQYIFSGTGITGNGNASTTNLYLEKDGQANAKGSSGSSPTYARGTWVENADKSLTVSIDGTDYSVDYCDIAGKEGYRVTYSSTTMYLSLSGEAIEYTDVDFNGETLLTMLCGEGDYTLEFTAKGFAILKENGTQSVLGKYTKDGDTYTVTLDGKTYVSEGNTLTVSYEKAGNSSNTETVERTFNVDGTQPEAPAAAPAAEGDGASQEGGEAAPAAEGDGASQEGAPADNQ